MISVLCFGNDLHGDDGFGQAVAQQLGPTLINDDSITVSFCGTNSQRVWPLIENASSIIMVDALHAETDAAGTLRWQLDHRQFNEKPDLSHQGGVAELIRHLPLMFTEQPVPETFLLTCVAQDITPCSQTLSTPVANAIPLACSMILDKIQSCKEVASDN